MKPLGSARPPDPPSSLPPDDELKFEFCRSSGPGGQNVNKVSTAVRLRFDLHRSRSLAEDVRARLVELAGNRITARGVLVIEARRFRTQERNRQDALERLRDLIRKARRKPRRRRPTKPTAKSRLARLEQKRRKSTTKQRRAAPDKSSE